MAPALTSADGGNDPSGTSLVNAADRLHDAGVSTEVPPPGQLFGGGEPIKAANIFPPVSPRPDACDLQSGQTCSAW